MQFWLCALKPPYTEYGKDLRDLGDTPGQDPYDQNNQRLSSNYSDLDAIFESLPLVSYKNRCLKSDF